MMQHEHKCARCEKKIPAGQWYCDGCLRVIDRRSRWEELADREEARDERDGRRM
jgi:predicted Fe-S protein YdhL (DUF1289 family)